PRRGAPRLARGFAARAVRRRSGAPPPVKGALAARQGVLRPIFRPHAAPAVLPPQLAGIKLRGRRSLRVLRVSVVKSALSGSPATAFRASPAARPAGRRSRRERR